METMWKERKKAAISLIRTTEVCCGDDKGELWVCETAPESQFVCESAPESQFPYSLEWIDTMGLGLRISLLEACPGVISQVNFPFQSMSDHLRLPVN